MAANISGVLFSFFRQIRQLNQSLVGDPVQQLYDHLRGLVGREISHLMAKIHFLTLLSS
jgi:hypothetical protein